MKVGMRKPYIKKSFKARTTGQLKRQVKRSINPLYGKKGMGWINNPKKAAYNKIYHKTTFGVNDVLRAAKGSSKGSSSSRNSNYNRNNSKSYTNMSYNTNNFNETIEKYGNVAISKKVSEMEKSLGVDTRACRKPIKFIITALVLIAIGTVILPLLFIALILDITGLVLICKRNYWTAYRWNRAIYMYVTGNKDKSRMYLDKLPYSEKQREAYRTMQTLLDENIPYDLYKKKGYSYSSCENNTFDENMEDNSFSEEFNEGFNGYGYSENHGFDDYESSEEFSDEIVSYNNEENLEAEVCNKIKDMLLRNNRDLTYFRVKHRGVYTDMCVYYVFLRLKLNGKKQYILSNIDTAELEDLNFDIENPSKAENYKNRINLTSMDVIDRLEYYILKDFDQCSKSMENYLYNNKNGQKNIDDYLLNE